MGQKADGISFDRRRPNGIHVICTVALCLYICTGMLVIICALKTHSDENGEHVVDPAHVDHAFVDHERGLPSGAAAAWLVVPRFPFVSIIVVVAVLIVRVARRTPLAQWVQLAAIVSKPVATSVPL